MPIALNGWHPGERALHSKLGPGFTSGPMVTAYTWIDGSMPEQHRIFYMHNLPFLPLTTKDVKGRPWAALVSGIKRSETAEIEETGKGYRRWIESPSETELVMDLEMWEGDPMLEGLNLFDTRPEEKILTAGLGIEFPTRRRNKFAGWIERVEKTGPNSRRVYMHVNQAIGNCPKYINIRTLDPYPHAFPEVSYRNLEMSPEDRLPDKMIKFILQSDTVFLGTSYEASESDKVRCPSHVGMNARSGRPGLVRVRPSDGRTLVLPDYSGNRLMTSLGNVEASSRAAMSFLDFTIGSVLYITGTARNLVGAEAQALMPRQNVLTTLYAEAFMFVRNALPVRQRPGTDVGRSPYSPPIKFLAEEKELRETHVPDDVFVTLVGIKLLSPTLAIFTFGTDKTVTIRPGQAVALNFTDLFGASQYAHMAPGREASLNDDRIRTWTVSSASTVDGDETKKLDLTMREKPGGFVTGALFNLARHASAKMPAVLEDSRPLGLRVRLVGITGSFTLPFDRQIGQGRVKMFWLAGGIGITPFLSMLKYICSSAPTTTTEYDVALMLVTREPDVLLRLISDSLTQIPTTRLNFSVHIFSSSDGSLGGNDGLGSNVSVITHRGRPKFSGSKEEMSISLVPDVTDRLVYLCGPREFEEAALEALCSAGVERESVMREGFEY
ncbi:hypothetical protein A7U60_g7930 [Sanghuangporus baumii]|uniref:FAD-binding FR-type domain-containing protein n=1 Tax=Sanghuangporus baumii TaxID=108892 RepID=A0A9Q5N476_SANBA|nr:hypothetical protein A7U60_g7930 [Sanghuangporus baumii]